MSVWRQQHRAQPFGSQRRLQISLLVTPTRIGLIRKAVCCHKGNIDSEFWVCLKQHAGDKVKRNNHVTH